MNTEGLTAINIYNYLMTKQNFMQLCADLVSLYQRLQNPTDEDYQDLLVRVKDAMKTNGCSEFPCPAVLTLIWLCQSAGIGCNGTTTTGTKATDGVPSFQCKLLVGSSQ